MSRLTRTALPAAMFVIAAPATAHAAPTVDSWECLKRCYPGNKVRGGSVVELRGAGLGSVKRALLARRREARVLHVSDARVRVALPGDARSGPLRLVAPGRDARVKRLAIVAPPAISEVRCLRSCDPAAGARAGSLLEVRGRRLTGVRIAAFRGRPGRADDRRGRVGKRRRWSRIKVRVPWEALDGELQLGARGRWVSDGRPLDVAEVPVAARWRCIKSCAGRRRARAGSLLLVRGVRLGTVTRAVFTPRGGAEHPARVSHQSFRSVRVRVPADAARGRFRLETAAGARSPERRIRVMPAAIFPIRGRHDYGGHGAAFGAGRGTRAHRGHDVFAACGTRLVAARGGRVRYAGYQSSAGHYIVIAGRRPRVDYVYMHLQSTPRYGTGDRVRTGATIGAVGESGNARGCHLHFEMWSAPGWYRGGEPFDPLPYLRAWDRYS